MREISDLTKDTRPSLEEVLRESIHDIIEIDMNKSNDDGGLVEYENNTFYYRVIFLFLQKVINYYSEKEVEKWCKTELLNEIVLPEIGLYGESNL